MAVGALVWLGIGDGRGLGWERWLTIGVLAATSLIPQVSTRIAAFLENIRNPSIRAIRLATILVAIAATIYFIATAFAQGRDLFPKTHDECSYYLGMQQLAIGRLWTPQHPLADFFESFYILVKPVYCSIYFPGTALIFVPTIWLKLPTWLMPAMVGGASAGLLYRIMCEVIDGVAGAMAALLLVSLTWFRTLTMMLMAQAPMLLLGLVLIWAWLKWRKNPSWRWALLIGIVAGWAAITRPADAVAFVFPIGIAMATGLWRKSASKWFSTAAIVVAGAVPFIVLQLVFDLGVTGRLFQTPYTLYLQREVPGATFGFHKFDPDIRPQSQLPQQGAEYTFSQTYFARHQLDNFWKPWVQTQYPQGYPLRPAYLAMIADTTLPARFLLILLLPGVLGLAGAGRIVLFCTWPLFVLLYLLNPFFLEHYAIPLIPSVLLLLLLGLNVLSRAWPRLEPFLVVVVVATALTSLWEINHLLVRDPQKQVVDEALPSEMLRKVHDLYGERAVVLFRWSPGQNWKAEPVYNSEVAWPDEAEVIKAHDLGQRDVEIINYYAKLQPDRVFFVWEQKGNEMSLRRIASAAALANALREGRTVQQLLH